MSLQIVRFTAPAEQGPEVEEAITQLFTALERVAPTGVSYSAVRVGDGAEFLLTLQLADAATNPLTDIAEARSLRAKIADWAGAPVPPQPATVLGRYAR